MSVAVAAVFLSSAWPAVAGWRPERREAIRYIATRSGNVSFAVKAPGGRLVHYRGGRQVAAASVIKAMFMTAYLRMGSVRSRRLRERDRSLLAPMIKRSNNETATRIANILGPRRMYRLARDAGMRRFHYTRPWGSSRITAADQARFFFRLERYIPRRHEVYARYLLSHVTRSQRWGIGELHKPNWRFFFKGGWGSGTGAVCHQAAFIERGDKRIAAAVMITGSPNHDYATNTLRGVFRRLLRDLPKPR
jgi:beta-lactamase class A